MSDLAASLGVSGGYAALGQFLRRRPRSAARRGSPGGSPAIAALARDDGPLQTSLFDTQNFAEITRPGYPGQRLICCHNPMLEAGRARTRQELLAATQADLAKIKTSAGAGRLKDPGKTGIRAGKMINKRKVAKHLILDIGPGRLAWHRDGEKIAAEAPSAGST